MSTKIMAILNSTDDSFFDGSHHKSFIEKLGHGLTLIKEGADILDIGGESTRPGAKEISIEEELNRVIPLIRAIRKESQIPISIDSSKWQVAESALDAGANMINDVTGFTDPMMRRVAAESGCEICIMHMQGNPRSMQANPEYPRGVLNEIKDFFSKQISLCLQDGIQREKIFLDPGIGFGKTLAHNKEILQNLEVMRAFDLPLLLGISRKSFMGKILQKSAEDLLPATLAVNLCLMQKAVEIIRVHDVTAHKDSLKIMNAVF